MGVGEGRGEEGRGTAFQDGQVRQVAGEAPGLAAACAG